MTERGALLVTATTADTLKRARSLVTDLLTRLAAIESDTRPHSTVELLFTVSCGRHTFNFAFFVSSFGVARL